MITTAQLKAARNLLEWNQQQLAEASGIAISTIKKIESRGGPLRGNADSIWKIEAAIMDAGAVFIDENGGGAGVRLRNRRER
ncbi:MAG: helix-turn-helix transcriptional regulator [Proteobacteria bacterium]|nr:helix-turn-helix transcriptional regulator [Pseudomonadota bacterium]